MNEDREWKDSLYSELARIGKCLSSPKRLELIDALSHSPRSVEQLSRMTGMSVANVSQHLQVLYEGRLVQFTKKGNYVIYALADDGVSDFAVSFRLLAERRLTEVQRIKAQLMKPYEEMEPITLEALQALMQRGETLLIDVRPREEYEQSHIPGAVSVPFDELERQLSSLPSDVDIVAYCRGPYCVTSAQAVELLRRRGLRAHRLEEGVLEWRLFTEEKRGGTNDVA